MIRVLANSVERIVAPGRLDGGDVLVTRDHVLVGRSSRSNQRGAAQLAGLAACRRRKVVSIEVEGALHLKTILTALPDGSLLAAPGLVNRERLVQLGYTVREAYRPTEANVMCIHDTVVMAAGAPETAALLRELGMRVTTVDISELQKLEAGVTCLSVLL
jgi:dimethylargininase